CYNNSTVIQIDCIPQQLLDQQVDNDTATGGAASKTKGAEEMQGPRKILEQKLDGEDIEQHAKSAADPVVRIPRRARRIADGNLGDARPVKARQRWNEAMQLAVQIHVLQHFGAIRL